MSGDTERQVYLGDGYYSFCNHGKCYISILAAGVWMGVGVGVGVGIGGGGGCWEWGGVEWGP